MAMALPRGFLFVVANFGGVHAKEHIGQCGEKGKIEREQSVSQCESRLDPSETENVPSISTPMLPRLDAQHDIPIS